MSPQEARRIGRRQALKAVLIGATVAYLLMAAPFWTDGYGFGSLRWIVSSEFALNLLIGLLICGVAAYVLGGLAGKEILLQGRNAYWIGARTACLVLWITALLGSLTGFMQEGLAKVGTPDNPFEDYVFKPFFWVSVFGTIPAILIGLWFGKSVRNRGKEAGVGFSCFRG